MNQRSLGQIFKMTFSQTESSLSAKISDDLFNH